MITAFQNLPNETLSLSVLFCSRHQNEGRHSHAIYGTVICHLLVVGVYVRHSPDILCVEAHPLDLHFHSVSHVITYTHTHTHTHSKKGIRIRSWCICPETIRLDSAQSTARLSVCVTWTAEVNMLVLVVGAAPQTPGVVGQGEEVLQPGRVSDGSV